MGINFNPNITFRRAEISQPAKHNVSTNIQSKPDVFIRTDNSAKYIERLEELFPYGELADIYNSMCKELELDYPPALKFETGAAGEAGGGYSFSTNKITLNIQDVLSADYKIIGILDGEKEILVEPKTMTPLFTSKAIAGLVVNNPKNAVLKGYDKLVAEPVTDEEQRKLFLMKLRHELIHAKQHMIMRQTEGIGAKAVIKAWAHIPAGDKTPKYILDQIIHSKYKQSFWVNIEDNIKYKTGTPEAEYASKCLNAVQNYPPVASSLYNSNFIEVEAYREANKYITENFGGW